MDEQIKSLKFSLCVGQKQIIEIESRLKVKFEDLPDKDPKKDFLCNEAIYLYLKNFWQQFEFLVKKVEEEKDAESFQFYIPLIRILFENYGELMYLINQSRQVQLGLYSHGYLLYLSDFYRFIGIGNEDISTEYNRLKGLWNEILSDEGISFPDDIKSFTYSSFKNGNYDFPQIEQFFQKPYFTEQSSITFALWEKDNASTFYNKYYRSHSNYTHPSFTNQMSFSTKNEIFWIVQFLYIIGQLMVELGNKKIFKGKFESEYDELTQHIALAYPVLQGLWHPKKPER